MRPARQELRRKLLAEAQRLLAAEGAAGVQARRLADATALSVGTIYNLFGSMDELLLATHAETFRELRAVGARAAGASSDEPDLVTRVTQRLFAIADAYAQFVHDNDSRWTAALAFNRSSTLRLPNWYRGLLFSLYSSIEDVLVELPGLDQNRRRRTLVARALFSSVNGIVDSAVGRALTPRVIETIRAQNRLVIRAVVGQQRGEA